MDCILFRHGIAADWRDWQKEDHARPLTDEGIEKTRKAVKGLIRLGVSPTHFLCMPLPPDPGKTADIAKETLGVTGELQLCVETAARMHLRKISSIRWASFSGDDCVLCVGHEPLLGHTAGVMVLSQPVSRIVVQKGRSVLYPVSRKASTRGTGALQWVAGTGSTQETGEKLNCRGYASLTRPTRPFSPDRIRCGASPPHPCPLPSGERVPKHLPKAAVPPAR